jgi:altronate dehydratase small subunit
MKRGCIEMINALTIDAKDTVAVAIEPIAKGSEAEIRMKDGSTKTVVALDDIRIYHKFAIADMPKGTPVVKYGEHIGIAGCDIKVGNHVHTHNVESHRENLDNK